MLNQTEIRTLSECPKPKLLDNSLISKCRDGKDAILLCIQARTVRHSQYKLAEALGIEASHFSRILSGKAHLPDEVRTTLMELCGNLAPLQYEAMAMGFTLAKEDKKAKEIKELRDKLEQLEAMG